MNCRKFKSNHVGFIDDLLSAADMADMRLHISDCSRCATLDVRIRRSLLVMRNLPQIQPSADFFARLNEALKRAPTPAPVRRPAAVTTTFVAATAALAAAVYFALAVGVDRSRPKPSPTVTTASFATAAPPPITDAAMVAAVPAGIPVWPAMFMVGELPIQLANAELLDNGIGR